MTVVMLLLLTGTAGEWQPLFNRLPEGAEGWSVDNGVLHAYPASPLRTTDLVSPRQFRDFEFEVEYRVAPGGNSGIRYLPLSGRFAGVSKAAGLLATVAVLVAFRLRRRPLAAAGAAALCFSPAALVWSYLNRHPLALEFQALDNERHRDGMRGPLYRAGALYGLSPAREDASRPAGEWNLARLAVCGNRVEHWLNGKQIVEADLSAPRHREARARFYGQGWYRIFLEREWSRLGFERPSSIGLQHHGEEVWFRNARVRELNCGP